MTQIIRFFIVLACTLGLAACANLSSNLAPENANLSWVERSHALSRLDQWDLSASVGIRTTEAAESTNLSWQQNKQTYTLSLFGPLGSNAFKLQGQPGKVIFKNPQGKIFSALTAEIILAQQTGWRLPVSYLNYWIRGLPVPGLPATKQFDAFHHLLSLQQAGWKIQYMRYTFAQGLDLPSKLSLTYPGLQVKIIIHQWRLNFH